MKWPDILFLLLSVAAVIGSIRFLIKLRKDNED